MASIEHRQGKEISGSQIPIPGHVSIRLDPPVVVFAPFHVTLLVAH